MRVDEFFVTSIDSFLPRSYSRASSVIKTAHRNMESLRPLFETSPALGPLEQQVLQAVWARGPVTVRELLDHGEIWQSYSTIMTTMDRLFKKGLLDREPQGRAFRYSARVGPKELEHLTAVKNIEQLLGSKYASLHLSYFVEAVSEKDASLLDHLQTLVERQRAELRKEKEKDR